VTIVQNTQIRCSWVSAALGGLFERESETSARIWRSAGDVRPTERDVTCGRRQPAQDAKRAVSKTAARRDVTPIVGAVGLRTGRSGVQHLAGRPAVGLTLPLV